MRDADSASLAALRIRGFALTRAAPSIAALLFAVDAALVAWWFTSWIILGNTWNYDAIVDTVGASSLIYYAATLVTMLWALKAVRNHETIELLVHEEGSRALNTQKPELGEDLVRRWEQQTNRVVLFLVIALPISFSPTIFAHLVLTGTVWLHELALPAICFVLAGVFHVWGTILLVGLYNGHLDAELHFAVSATRPSNNEPRIGVATASTQTGGYPERELVAIMLTDMFGYSKAMERDEAQAYGRLMEHNQIMRGAIAEHRGREIKTIGDAFLVTFRSAIDAVDCALAAQRALADYNLGKKDDDRILVRIGIHLGDVLFADNDVFGDGVNVASRIEALAEPGGICVSEPVFEMVRKKVQLDIQKVEGAQLKNIAIAPNLYRIRLAP
jgi:class 3 adenylate cyclase